MSTTSPTFALTVLNPPMIFGPYLPSTFSRLTLSDLNQSNKRFHEGYIDTKPEDGLPHNALRVYVDVRDLARAHVVCLEREGVHGERIIVCKGEVGEQKVCDLLRRERVVLKERTPRGEEGKGRQEGGYGKFCF